MKKSKLINRYFERKKILENFLIDPNDKIIINEAKFNYDTNSILLTIDGKFKNNLNFNIIKSPININKNNGIFNEYTLIYFNKTNFCIYFRESENLSFRDIINHFNIDFNQINFHLLFTYKNSLIDEINENQIKLEKINKLSENFNLIFS